MPSELSTKSSRRSPEDVPPTELSHFQSHPLAHPTLSDPSFHIFHTSRTLSHSGRGHTLMALTWNTSETIAHHLSLYRPPSSPSPSTALDLHPDTRAEVRRFYTFGTHLNAHPDLLHGGVVACLLDSTMGNVIPFASPESFAGKGAGMFTAQLNVKYERPVRTPGTVRVRSWVRGVEEGGRKVWVEGVVEGWAEGGDKGVVVHARGDGVWVRPRKKTGKGKL